MSLGGVADKLRLRTIGVESVTLADGREVELAPIYIELLGRGTHALAAIIEAPEPILGTSVMEVLGLVIDPKSEKEEAPEHHTCSFDILLAGSRFSL